MCYVSLEDVCLCINFPVHAQGGYFLPSTSGFSTIPEVPGQPFHMSGGVTSRGLRHSASAMELPRSGTMSGPLHEGFPMFGPGAAMGPLSNMPHFGSPRAQQVNSHAPCCWQHTAPGISKYISYRADKMSDPKFGTS